MDPSDIPLEDQVAFVTGGGGGLRFPEYEVQPDGLERTYSSNVSGYSTMPIEVAAR